MLRLLWTLYEASKTEPTNLQRPNPKPRIMAQRLRHPFIGEYTLNRIRDPTTFLIRDIGVSGEGVLNEIKVERRILWSWAIWATSPESRPPLKLSTPRLETRKL